MEVKFSGIVQCPECGKVLVNPEPYAVNGDDTSFKCPACDHEFDLSDKVCIRTVADALRLMRWFEQQRMRASGILDQDVVMPCDLVEALRTIKLCDSEPVILKSLFVHGPLKGVASIVSH